MQVSALLSCQILQDRSSLFAFVLLYRRKLDVLWVVLAGGVIGLGRALKDKVTPQQKDSPHSGDKEVQDLQRSVVMLYVVPDCPLCAHARSWLERHGITYVERNVAHHFGSLRRMYTLTGQRLVPVFEVEGQAIVRPTDRELEEFLFQERESEVRSHETE